MRLNGALSLLTRTLQVHSYLAAPGERTAYLSELQTGAEVLVVDPQGRQRTAVVGRIKVERRPLVRFISSWAVCREASGASVS